MGLFGPDIFIVAIYLVALIALFLCYGVRMEFSHFKLWSIFLSTLFVIYLSSVVIQRLRSSGSEHVPLWIFAGKRLIRFILDWFPTVALITIYENLREYTGIIRQDQIDAALLKMDVWLFGVEPTVWIQKFTHPLITEYLAFTYSIYLILPLSLAWLLYVIGKKREFHILTTSVILCLCMGFVLFLIFPAGPPRFFIADQFVPRELVGAFGYYNAMQARFDAVNPMTYRASFPSLHVGLSTLAICSIALFRKRIRFGYLLTVIYGILVLSLWIATVYLRHHWFVDIAAGWLVAGIAIVISIYIHKRISFRYEYEE